MKDSVKPVFDIKVMTKNGVIFCAYLQREHEISAMLASISEIMNVEKAHIMTGHHNEEQTCKITYIRHNNEREHKVWIKIANGLQWKLGVTTEYTGKGMSQRNQIAEQGFKDITGAMMVQANLPEEIRYKLCKECLIVLRILVT